jgi:hypothetical protein
VSKPDAGGNGGSASPRWERGSGSDTLQPGVPVDLAAARLIALVVETSAEPELFRLNGGRLPPGPCFVEDSRFVLFFKAGDNPPLHRPGFAYHTSGVIHTPPAGNWLFDCEPGEQPVTPLPAWAYDPDYTLPTSHPKASPAPGPLRNGEEVSASRPSPDPLIDNHKVKSQTSRWPPPVLASELSDVTAFVEWLWHGCIARGHVTLFSALMKSGKSTLVGHLLRSLQDGSSFVGRQTQKCRTLVVSEESHSTIRSRSCAARCSRSRPSRTG